MTLGAANVIIGLDPRLSWAHMGMASFNLTWALLLWQWLLLSSKRESAKLGPDEKGKYIWKRRYWLAALGIPLFLSGLFPWASAHWYNLTVVVVVGCGVFAMKRMRAVHQEMGPTFRLREGPLFLGAIFAAFFFVSIFSVAPIAFPHFHSNSPRATLSGLSADGQYLLHPTPGDTPLWGLKWTVNVYKRDDTGKWKRFYPWGFTSGRPRHLSGSFIEGKWERSLRARWTGENTFEISYIHAEGGGFKKDLYRYNCTIEEDAEEQVQCQYSVESPWLLKLFGNIDLWY